MQDPQGNGLHSRLSRALKRWREQPGSIPAVDPATPTPGLTTRILARRAVFLVALTTAGTAGSLSVWGLPGQGEESEPAPPRKAAPALAASRSRSPLPAPATSVRPRMDPAERFLGYIIEADYPAPDTLRYRVCKDLAACYLQVAAPPPGVVPWPAPAAAPPLALTPVNVYAAALLPRRPGLLLGIPLIGLLWLPHSHGHGATPPPVPPVPPPLPPPGPPGPPVPPPTTVPEPMTVVLVGSGLIGMAAARRRQRRDQA